MNDKIIGLPYVNNPVKKSQKQSVKPVDFKIALWKTNNGFVWQIKMDIYNVRLASYFENLGTSNLFEVYMLISSRTKKVITVINGTIDKIFVYVHPWYVIEKKS